MGTLAGHLVPGMFLIGLGVWHLIRAVASYSRSPREYIARVWYPMSVFRGRVKHLELYILLVTLPVFIIYRLAVTIDFQSLVKIGVPIYRVLDFQMVAVILGFWLVTIIVLVSETTLWLPLPAEAPFLLAAVVFGIQWMVLSGGHAEKLLGLEGRCDLILAKVAAAGAVCSGILTWKPRAFLAELVLSESIILQGTWMVQTGLSLYVKRFIPEGCHRLLDLPQGIDGSTRCDLEEARARAFALMDLAFICHLLLAMLLSSLLYCGVARVARKRTVGYDPLAVVDVENNNSGIQMKAMPKQAQF